MPDSDKTKVRAAFDRAADTYDAFSHFQQRVCDHLLVSLSDRTRSPEVQTRMLDVGCGTGYGADLLRRTRPDARIIACDLAPAMVQKTAERGIEATCADVEKLPFADGHFDICWSSLTLQWCDPIRAFSELWRVLANNGELVFSTLGPGTLHELEFAFKDIDQYCHVLPFFSIEQITSALNNAGFSKIELHAEVWSTYHQDMKSLLSSIRGIGANHLRGNRRRSLMGKTAWRNAQTRYAMLGTEEGLPTSYNVIFGTARKIMGK